MKATVSVLVVLFSFVFSFLAFADEYRPTGELTAGSGISLVPSKSKIVRQGIPSGPYMVEIIPTYGPRIGAPGRDAFVSQTIGSLTGVLGALPPVSKLIVSKMVAGAGFDSQLNFAFRVKATNGTIMASQVTGRIESLDVIFNGSFSILANGSPEVKGKRSDGVWETITSPTAPYLEIVGLGPAGNFRIATAGEIAQIAGYISRQDLGDYLIVGSVNGVEGVVSYQGFPSNRRISQVAGGLVSLSHQSGHWAAIQENRNLGATNGWVTIGVVQAGRSFPVSADETRYFRLWAD